ncbi:MAG: protein translocase subunit SecF [Fusobacteriaceae bacterium]
MRNIDIIKRSKLYVSISAVFVVLSLGILLTKGLNYGIDFTGGNLFQMKFQEAIDLPKVNGKLDEIAREIPQLDSRSRKVQISEDNTVIIRTQEMKEEVKEEFIEKMKGMGEYSLEKTEKVGASVGKDLKNAALYSIIIGSILITLYITMRYEFKFAIGAILTLIHDVVIALGVIALLGYEINTEFIAATLTILGYSINDTIIIYDRIREKLKEKEKRGATFGEILNISLNDVMIRSINTSVTTLLAAGAILIFGGDSLKTFIVTLIVGILAGSYSSIFVAAPLVYLMDKDRDGKGTIEFKDEDEDYEEKIVV